METVDLSYLAPNFPGVEYEFAREIRIGEEKGRIVVRLWQAVEWCVEVRYSRSGKPRSFPASYYELSEVPAALPRKLVRLGASDAWMRLLGEAYEEILAQVSDVVPHEELHTDNPEYDF